MAYFRPTLAALVAEGAADIMARLPGGSVLLRRSVLWALNHAFAGGRHELYGYIDRLARNLLADTAEDDYLRRLATLRGVLPKAGTGTVLAVQVAGTDGTTLGAGAILVRGDGVTYATLADATPSGGVATVNVQAQPSASTTDPYALGSAGNADAGTVLALQTGVPGIIGSATVLSTVTPGADAESTDSLRARLLLVLRNPPQGGTRTDYINWALAVPAVTAAWCYPLQYGIGTVGLTFLCGGRTNPIPTSDDVAAVQAYIDSVRPVSVSGFTAWAPTADTLSGSIANLSPDTAANRAAMQAAWNAQILRDATPGPAYAVPAQTGGTLYLNRLEAALSAAGTVASFDLSGITYAGTPISPPTDVTAAAGHIAVAGTLSFT